MSTWRTGRKLGRTLYCNDVCVGMVDSPEIAAAVVKAMNERAPCGHVPNDGPNRYECTLARGHAGSHFDSRRIARWAASNESEER